MTSTNAFAETTLRPGLLVSIKTSITGNVSYIKTALEARAAEDGASKARWETERTILDAAEHDAAAKLRGNARALIVKVCASTAFGALCPESDIAELNAAVAEARQLCVAFNSTAKLTRVRFYVIVGRISPTDAEAVKAVNGELRELLTDMEKGVKNFDVKLIREAAAKAKQLGSMLSPDAQARIQIAIEAARGTAKELVKAGETAAKEIDQRTLRTLTEARTAFLDLDADREVAAPEVAAGRAVEFEAEPTFIGVTDPDDQTTILNVEV